MDPMVCFSVFLFCSLSRDVWRCRVRSGCVGMLGSKHILEAGAVPGDLQSTGEAALSKVPNPQMRDRTTRPEVCPTFALMQLEAPAPSPQPHKGNSGQEIIIIIVFNREIEVPGESLSTW